MYDTYDTLIFKCLENKPQVVIHHTGEKNLWNVFISEVINCQCHRVLTSPQKIAGPLKELRCP